MGTRPRGAGQPSELGRREVRAGRGAASFAPSVRGFRAPVRRGSGLWVGSGAPSPGLCSLSEAGPAPPTPGDTHPPISRRSSGSCRSSRSRRNRGRRHPRPRSRPTPSAPPAGRPEIASSASRPRHREMASRLGRRATPRSTPQRGRRPPARRPQRPLRWEHELLPLGLGHVNRAGSRSLTLTSQ